MERGYGLLRSRRMYARRYVYYIAIAVDFVLRYAWMYQLIPSTTLPEVVRENSDLYICACCCCLLCCCCSYCCIMRGEGYSRARDLADPFLSAAEICRRAMWGCFRVEWEHLNRSRLDKAAAAGPAAGIVPMHIDTTAKPDSHSKKRTLRQVVIEGLVFTAVVAGIVLVAALTKT